MSVVYSCSDACSQTNTCKCILVAKWLQYMQFCCIVSSLLRKSKKGKHAKKYFKYTYMWKLSFSFLSPVDDKTRVPIGDKQDYINASYIRMQVGNNEFFYISCQGPLPSTVPAFWQMIWENKSDVIAMMTQEVERGRIKCHKYWPERLDVPLDTGRYKIHLENQQYLEYFQIKVIRMVETEVREKRRVPASVIMPAAL